MTFPLFSHLQYFVFLGRWAYFFIIFFYFIYIYTFFLFKGNVFSVLYRRDFMYALKEPNYRALTRTFEQLCHSVIRY